MLFEPFVFVAFFGFTNTMWYIQHPFEILCTKTDRYGTHSLSTCMKSIFDDLQLAIMNQAYESQPEKYQATLTTGAERTKEWDISRACNQTGKHVAVATIAASKAMAE
jgi:hypothetical protein